MLLDERIKRDLLKLYPDGKVSKLATNHISLYNEVRNISKTREFTVSEYIKYLGLESVRTRAKTRKSYEEKLEPLLHELTRTFPDKNITDIGYSRDNIYYQLNNKINNFCQEFGISKRDFNDKHGFFNGKSYGDSNSHTTRQNPTQLVIIDKANYKYDIDTIKLLCIEYNLSQKVFSELFEVSRQAISLIINRETKYSANWVVNQLEQDILAVFKSMIKARTTEKVTDEEGYYICSNRDVNNPKFSFLYTYKIEKEVLIQCLLNPPSEIHQLLLEHHFNLFSQTQLEKLKEFIAINDEYKLKNEQYYLQAKEKNVINLWIREHSALFSDFSSFKEYFKLDKIFYTRKESREEKYRELLEKFYDPELDIVKIPIEDKKNYIKVIRAAGKRGQTLQEFIESFGFNYLRRIPVAKELKRKEYLEYLRPYILEDGNIYISSMDPVYMKFHLLGLKHGCTLSEYLKIEFNLKRYSHIRDVPSHLSPHIVKPTFSDESVEKLIEKIKTYYLLNEDDTLVYIAVNTHVYLQIFKHSLSMEKEMNEVLSEWGFKRLNKREAAEYLKSQDASDADIQEVLAGGIDTSDSEPLLKALEDIQSSINNETLESKRAYRSQKLVQLLKEAYDYKCQLCSDHSAIPRIILKDGKYYVEVHHVVPLHEQNSFNDESEVVLDNYKNAAVVCTHHHKVLHYHLGGFFEIKNIDGNYYFVNEHEKLLINTNHHLEENHQLVK